MDCAFAHQSSFIRYITREIIETTTGSLPLASPLCSKIFKIISAEGWGNAEVLRVAYNHSDRGPEGTNPITKNEAEQLGIYNYTDAMNDMMTWRIVQKI